MFKICNSASKFARLCGIELPKDVFVHVAAYLNIAGPHAVMNLHKNDSEIDQIDFLKFLFGTKDLISCFDDLLGEIISEENVKILLPILSKNLDVLKKLSEKQCRNLITKIESTSIASLAPRDYSRFKEQLLPLLFEARSSYNFIFDGVICFTDAIIKDKNWRKMNKDQLIKAQELFEAPSKHFIYSEIIIAWVTEKKPAQEVVTELTQALKLYKLDVDYMFMLNDKYKAIGYSEPVSAELLSSMKRPNHYLSNTVYNKSYSAGFIMRFTISCRSTCNVSPYYYIWFNTPQSGKEEHSWGWYSSVPDDFLRCPHDTEQVAVDKGPLMFYGATNDNVHLQLNTDWADAMSKWRQGQYVLKVGCMQFNKVSNQ